MKLVYYDGIKARYLAEAGAKKAYMKISNDEYFRQQLKINHAAINLNSAKQEFNNGLYEVAVKYRAKAPVRNMVVSWRMLLSCVSHFSQPLIATISGLYT